MAYFTTRDGEQLYYEECGAGKTVIMVHGWKGTSDAYAPVCERLQDSFRCIRYDQRGHMRSSKPEVLPKMADLGEDLNEIIHAFCPDEKPVVIGWSMGAATVLEYLKRYGCGHVERIILVDQPPRSLNDENWTLGRVGGTYTQKELEADIALTEKDFMEFLRLYLVPFRRNFHEWPLEEQKAYVEKIMEGYSPAIQASLFVDLQQSDYRPVLPTITVPTGIFYASVKPGCRPEAAAYYAEHIPAETYLKEFPDATHALLVEYPELFAQEVRRFIAM